MTWDDLCCPWMTLDDLVPQGTSTDMLGLVGTHCARDATRLWRLKCLQFVHRDWTPIIYLPHARCCRLDKSLKCIQMLVAGMASKVKQLLNGLLSNVFIRWLYNNPFNMDLYLYWNTIDMECYPNMVNSWGTWPVPLKVSRNASGQRSQTDMLLACRFTGIL